MSQREFVRKSQAAAKLYLEMRGYEIIEQNWHQSRYGVDIIAKKKEVVYFVAVRCRSSDTPNNSLEAVTASQQKQAQLAATQWITEDKWSGAYTLAAIDIDNANFAVLSFTDSEP